MAYSDFDLRTVRERFGLTLQEGQDLYGAVPEVGVDPTLLAFLDKWAPAALAMNTEKARSEMIIAPTLMEAVRLSGYRLSLFSGITFDVDRNRGLTGSCDFILSRSPEQFFLQQPVLAVREAKREDIPAGLGQCVAMMVAAQTFNAQDGQGSGPVYGAVTTGSFWRFLKLEGNTAWIDLPEYYLHQLSKVLGILQAMAA
jgi:hypothetical protein